MEWKNNNTVCAKKNALYMIVTVIFVSVKCQLVMYCSKPLMLMGNNIFYRIIDIYWLKRYCNIQYFVNMIGVNEIF